MPPRRPLLAVLPIALALALIAALLLTPGASAVEIGSCTGASSVSWTGNGDGHSWDDSENWEPEEVPSAGKSVSISGNEAEEAEVEGGHGSICSLTVSGSDAFLTGTTLTLTGGLTWEGGEHDKAASELEGKFTVEGGADLGHKLALTGEGITVEGLLEVQGGTDLTLGGAPTELVAKGSAQIGGTLGGKAIVQSNQASGGDDNARFEAQHLVELGGDVESSQLDLLLGPSAEVDLDGHTWELPGLSFSRWQGGAQVKSSASGGTMAFSNLAELLLNGNVGVGADALISMRGSSLLGDGKVAPAGGPSGSTGALHGEGTLEWQAGEMQGQVQLQPGFHTVLDTTGNHRLVAEAGTLLRNEGTLTEQSGHLIVDGTPARIENWGTMRVDAGATLGCNSSDCGAAALDNTQTGAIEVLEHFPLTPPATTVRVEDMTVANNGDIEVGTGLTLLVEDGSRLTLAEFGQLLGAGEVRIGDQGSAWVVGTTRLHGGVTLGLDGEGAELHGGTVNAEGELFGGVLDAAAVNEGSFAWRNGGVEGQLLTDGQLRTTASGASGRHAIDGESFDTHVPTRDPTLLTLASPTKIEGVEVDIVSSDEPDSAVRVAAPLQIVGPEAGFTHGTSNSNGVLVEPTGLIEALHSTEIDVPLVVEGALMAPADATLLIPHGYEQLGPNAETLLGGGTISSEWGAESVGTVVLRGGYLYGPGHVDFSEVVNSGGTVSPTAPGGVLGTIEIEREYVQQLGGGLVLYLNGTSPGQYDTLKVDESAELSGALTVFDEGSGAPVGAVIPGVVTAPELTGTFANWTSPASAWFPTYRSGAVDLDLGAVSPPPAEPSNGGGSPPSSSSSQTQPPAPPMTKPPAKKKPLQCKKGFRRETHRGHQKCVRLKSTPHKSAHKSTAKAGKKGHKGGN